MNNKILVNSLQVDKSLLDLINKELLPATTLDKDKFWSNFEDIINDFTPKNKELLNIRDQLQSKIDSWHKENEFDETTFEDYKKYLKDIGYLCEEIEYFKVDTKNVDEEIKLQAGPQLVVPVKNARFALNAANARWGSLYDALYGTDVISKEGELVPTSEYNTKRGEAVVSYAKEHLDTVASLTVGSHKDAVEYKIVNNKLQVKLDDGQIV
jgi:malate synthase